MVVPAAPIPSGAGPPHSLWWGTRSAVWAGARRYKAAVVEARKKRKLQLHGLAFQTRAIGDFWNSLGDRQCHVIVDGVVHTGQAGRQCWEFVCFDILDVEWFLLAPACIHSLVFKIERVLFCGPKTINRNLSICDN